MEMACKGKVVFKIYKMNKLLHNLNIQDVIEFIDKTAETACDDTACDDSQDPLSP